MPDSFYGSDPAQLHELADETRSAANRIMERLWVLGARVRQVEWVGQDADEFRRRWVRYGEQPGMDLVNRLRERGEELEEQAIEQEIASRE